MDDAIIYIGTAAWSVPKAEDGPPFEAPGSQLERYARVFNSVEINSCFYRPHRAATYAKWAASVPDAFRFALKLPRDISHADDFVAAAREHLPGFVESSGALGEKFGCLLVQLPPKRRFEAAYARQVTGELGARFGGRLAIEPRHSTWFDGAADELLAQEGIARVAADPSRGVGNELVAGAEGLAYLRLHGSPRIYYSAYGPEKLGVWRTRIEAATERAAAVYCVFDNTAEGAALRDAMVLQAMMGDQVR